MLTIQGERNGGATLETQFPADVVDLDLSGFGLTSITLPKDLTKLEELDINGNRLHFLTLPSDLINLKTLNLDNNRLNSLTLPGGLRCVDTKIRNG